MPENGRKSLDAFIPIVGDHHYKVILRPETEYEGKRRTTVHKAEGISYVYGTVETPVGTVTEVIEVWFDRSKTRWTASSVVGWMEKHADRLPPPSTKRRAPTGGPASQEA